MFLWKSQVLRHPGILCIRILKPISRLGNFLHLIDSIGRKKQSVTDKRTMKISTLAELTAKGETCEILFWVGCAGSFDDRARRVTVAFARILEAAKIRFAVLGTEENCSGNCLPALRTNSNSILRSCGKLGGAPWVSCTCEGQGMNSY